jgi:hypothetical protein
MVMQVGTRLQKELAKYFQEFLIPALRDVGFDDFSECLAWRTTSTNVDVVGIVVESSSRVSQNLPENTIGFYLKAGTYYRAIELLPWIEITVKRSTLPKSQKGSPTDCHSRLALGHAIPVAQSLPTTLQVIGVDFEERFDDVRLAVINRALPWLESARDVDYILNEFDTSIPQVSPGWRRPQALASNDRELSYAIPHGDLLLGLLLSRDNYDQVLNLMRIELEFYQNGSPNSPKGRKLITSYMKQMAILYPNRIEAIQTLRHSWENQNFS